MAEVIILLPQMKIALTGIIKITQSCFHWWISE